LPFHLSAAYKKSMFSSTCITCVIPVIFVYVLLPCEEQFAKMLLACTDYLVDTTYVPVDTYFQ